MPAQFAIPFPVVDAHHHFWDLSFGHHPWLNNDPMIPFRYGDYSAIRRSYLPADYARDTQGFNVVQSVYMEAEWDCTDPIGETRWIKSVRREHGFPHAMVGQAWLDRADADDVLSAQASFGFVTGIRHKPRSVSGPEAVVRGAPGSMSDDRWRRGYELLGKYGLDFELQVVPWHFCEARELAQDFPDTRIIVNHTGVPVDRSEAGLSLWREAMANLADCDNVAVKISGIGQRGKPWTVAANREVVLETIRQFGVERCMFASNFPVDGLCGSFATIYGGFAEITQGFAEVDRLKLFHDNAKRIYRLP